MSLSGGFTSGIGGVFGIVVGVLLLFIICTRYVSPCTDCWLSGKCSSCSGSGSGMLYGSCSKCNGDKNCPKCHGKGYVFLVKK